MLLVSQTVVITKETEPQIHNQGFVSSSVIENNGVTYTEVKKKK